VATLRRYDRPPVTLKRPVRLFGFNPSPVFRADKKISSENRKSGRVREVIPIEIAVIISRSGKGGLNLQSQIL
jgi:hypothetical protein